MPIQQIRVSRKDLYEQVWSEPMTKVAERYRMSDVGLKKRCEKLKIPTPPRGYWAQVAGGMRPPIPPLQAASGISEFDVFYLAPIVHDRINVPSVLRPTDFARPLHPLVEETLIILRNNQIPDSRKKPPLDIYVVARRLERPGVLLSALLHAAERQGHEVGRNGLIVNGEHLDFYVTEELQYRPDPSWDGKGPKPPNVQKQALGFHFRIGHCPHEGRTSWEDGRKAPLEEQLDAILAELVPLSASLKPYRIELEAKRAERVEDERRRQAARDQLETLKRDVEAYRIAEDMRALVRHAEALYTQRDESQRFSKWKQWAEAIADEHDPFTNRQEDPLAKYFRVDDELWRSR